MTEAMIVARAVFMTSNAKVERRGTGPLHSPRGDRPGSLFTARPLKRMLGTRCPISCQPCQCLPNCHELPPQLACSISIPESVPIVGNGFKIVPNLRKCNRHYGGAARRVV